MSDISKILGCSVHKVVYWMDKYEIKRRTWSQATYVKLNPDGDPFKIKYELNDREKILYGLGLGIYWGEGDKMSRHRVRVANTDPNILRIFIRFLLEVCQLKKDRLNYSIICFNDSNPSEAKKYWAEELKISEEKFGKIVQIPPQGKGSYKRKSQCGVCTVDVGSITLKTWIIDEMYKLSQEICLDSSVAERFLGKKEVPSPILGQGSEK